MAARRARATSGPGQSRTTVARTAAVAGQLLHESSILLELYGKKEDFTDVSVADGRLVTVPPPSSQPDTGDKLWCLHSALLQCYSLLERAITKEEEELGSGKKEDYETQRKLVKDRLALLLINTAELLKAVDCSTVQTPSAHGMELDSPTSLFELKLWVYRIFQEIKYWTKTAVTTLQAMPSVIAKERSKTTGVRSLRSARR